MKRTAEQAELQNMLHCVPKSVRKNVDLPCYGSSGYSATHSADYQTPSKPIPVLTSTPHVRCNVNELVMEADADAELRRVIDNFVAIYEQLDRCEGSDVKPNYSYTELAYLAMLRSPNFCLPITEIYRYVQSRFLFFKNSTRKHWKNAVRHSLAKTMCFTKIPIGRGTSSSENLSRSTYLWCIIPNSIVSFARGDYRPNVDKESGTNTLRWGYMRVNAGQFWDQVGNYIAGRMVGFRKLLENSSNPGEIFEKQVCQVPDSNLFSQFQIKDNQRMMYNHLNYGDNSTQFGCHGYNRLSQYAYGALETMRHDQVIAVPAQGYLTDSKFCNYGNSPLLETTNRLGVRNNNCMINSYSCNKPCASILSRADRLTPPLKLTPPTRITSPPPLNLPQTMTPSTSMILAAPVTRSPRLTLPTSVIPEPSLTPPLRMTPPTTLISPPSLTAPLKLTPPHVSSNDSGFESYESSPEIEPSSCRLTSQPDSLDCSENVMLNSCDFLDDDLQLDFSDLAYPNLANFCDSLLTNVEEMKPNIGNGNLQHRSFREQSLMKENIPVSNRFPSFTLPCQERGPQTLQQQHSFHGDNSFGHSSLINPEDQFLWTDSKLWF